MKLITEYKHLYFQLARKKAKTEVWECWNRSGELLGVVEWYCSWRQYCFTSLIMNCIYSKGCLNDIADFINQLMTNHKEKKSNE